MLHLQKFYTGTISSYRLSKCYRFFRCVTFCFVLKQYQLIIVTFASLQNRVLFTKMQTVCLSSIWREVHWITVQVCLVIFNSQRPSVILEALAAFVSLHVHQQQSPFVTLHYLHLQSVEEVSFCSTIQIFCLQLYLCHAYYIWIRLGQPIRKIKSRHWPHWPQLDTCRAKKINF